MTPKPTFHLRAATLALTLAASMVPLSGSAADKPLTAQQSKMGTCNAAAAGKTGDERKAFMSDCLKTKPAAAKTSKMAQCNKDSKGKKGDERKTFMSSCMSAS